jgi:hypothetical protein
MCIDTSTIVICQLLVRWVALLDRLCMLTFRQLRGWQRCTTQHSVNLAKIGCCDSVCSGVWNRVGLTPDSVGLAGSPIALKH